jgi:hypothetical protein
MKKYSLIALRYLFSAVVPFTIFGDRENRCKTFQVNFFQNNAELIEPAIDRTFTLTLQDIIMNQTNLNLVKVVEI